MYNGHLYSVINPSPVESLPGIVIDDPERNLTCRDMRKALWARHKAPEMAYMLKHHQVESAFLSRLNCGVRDPPIVRTVWGYVLAPETREAWMELEDAFVKISDLLFASQTNNVEAKMPFDPHWMLPRETGYRLAHRTAAAARNAFGRHRTSPSSRVDGARNVLWPRPPGS